METNRRTREKVIEKGGTNERKTQRETGKYI